MVKNMSNTDRLIRLGVAIVIGILVLVGALKGAAAIILGILALVLLATALVGTCPLYTLVKFTTKKD